MKKNGRFMVGLVGVATVVTWLVWTGVSEAMVYYLTPVELIQRVDADPTFRDVGVRISGQVVPGTYRRGEGEGCCTTSSSTTSSTRRRRSRSSTARR